MKSDTLTPWQLFGKQVRYLVPMFQRPYVWKQDLQWEPLWQDVRVIAERQASAMATEPTAEVPPHFLGAIVLEQQLVPAAFLEVRHVIDGQQRLTTLQVLLDAVQAVTEE